MHICVFEYIRVKTVLLDVFFLLYHKLHLGERPHNVCLGYHNKPSNDNVPNKTLGNVEYLFLSITSRSSPTLCDSTS